MYINYRTIIFIYTADPIGSKAKTYCAEYFMFIHTSLCHMVITGYVNRSVVSCISFVVKYTLHTTLIIQIKLGRK
jgi:hypothetical protein